MATGDARQGGTLQRQCACGNHTTAGGECQECGKKRSGLQREAINQSANGAMGSLPSIPIMQRKLTIGASNDLLEQEADRVADQVLALPTYPAVSGAPPHIQRFAGQPTGQPETVPASVDRTIASPGRPLDPALRQDMEARFGHDFSQVRVHSDAAAEQSVRGVNANAYTVGHNIVFGAGRFAPGTHEGRRLIAHELTHVVQQQKGVQASVQRAPKAGGSSPGVTIGDVDVKSNDPNCEYEKGEAAKSHASKGILNYDIEKAEFFGINPADAVVIADFKVDDGELRPSTESDLRKYWIPGFDKKSLNLLEIVGYSDCVGWENRNKSLREKRAQSVARHLPGPLTRPAPVDEYLVPNTSQRGRALNRSVIIRPPPSPTPKPVPDPTPHVRITLQEPDTEACSKDQRNRLAVAFPAAKLMLKNAIGVISSMEKGSEEEVMLMKYFGRDAFSARRRIKLGFVNSLRAWDVTPTYQCVKQGIDPCESSTDRGYAGVWAFIKGSPIVICENAFTLNASDVELAEVVLHEATHVYEWTGDPEYCSRQTGCSLDTGDAVGNADSYSVFALEAFYRWGPWVFK